MPDFTINTDNLCGNYKSRLSPKTKKIVEDNNYITDVHVHLFDIKCINKSYFILRLLKDLVGLKAGNAGNTHYTEEEVYQQIGKEQQGWEKQLDEELEKTKLIQPGAKGFIDVIKARKFLKMKTMEAVYHYYSDNFSLAKVLNTNATVLTTALMMDLETGWETKIDKSMYEQVDELKALAKEYPVLPFLFCDPRRAANPNPQENLYALFNHAFEKDNSFFGVKIYPALGYDPSDYRLWPIYAACETYNIPVLTHCGGESVSTDHRQLTIFEGEQQKTITGHRRSDIAYNLNNPARWASVLQKFPKLKLNLAHFGGYETWEQSGTVPPDRDPQQRKATIFNFMQQYPNVYADFAYNIVDTKRSKNLINYLLTDENVRNRTLFGTDYWVVNKEDDLHDSQKKFLKEAGNYNGYDLVNKMVKTNTDRYLFGG